MLLEEPVGISAHSKKVLDLQVLDDFDAVPITLDHWDERVAALGGAVYMSFDWLRTWWQFYAGGRHLRLFLFSAEKCVVGIIPIYIDTLSLGPLKLRVAKLVGACVPPKVFNPPIDEAWADQIYQEILAYLLKNDRCDVISLGPVSELQNSFKALEKAARTQPELIGKLDTVKGVHSVFWSPASMDDYYASLSKNERKNRRKYELRLLKKEFDTRVEIVSESNLVDAEFERFAVQHAVQWKAEGKTGHFGAWPRALEFNRALVRAQARHGRLRFIRIVANGKIIANQYAFAFGDVYYWELPSREVTPDWDRFSLGPTGIVTMIEAGLNEGITRIEGGLAHYDYKVRLGAKEYAATMLRISAASRSARFKLRMFGALHACLSVLYHKIWYRRVVPRLPSFFWRPQWSLWLRFDF
jgi:hypothetical protein